MPELKNFSHKHKKNPYTYLFASIIILFMITPFFKGQHSLFVAFLFLLIMMSTILALDLNKSTLRLCFGLGLTAFGLTALNATVNSQEYAFMFELLTLISYIGFFLICIWIFLKKIFYIDTASWDSVRGGISVYFLMGLLYKNQIFFGLTPN